MRWRLACSKNSLQQANDRCNDLDPPGARLFQSQSGSAPAAVRGGGDCRERPRPRGLGAGQRDFGKALLPEVLHRTSGRAIPRERDDTDRFHPLAAVGRAADAVGRATTRSLKKLGASSRAFTRHACLTRFPTQKNSRASVRIYARAIRPMDSDICGRLSPATIRPSYSGLLGMADLLALQPNMNIKLPIVAPLERRDKVYQEIRRPVFSLGLFTPHAPRSTPHALRLSV